MVTARSPGGTSAATGPDRGAATRFDVMTSPAAVAVRATRPVACSGRTSAPAGEYFSGIERTSTPVTGDPLVTGAVATTTFTSGPGSGRAASSRAAYPRVSPNAASAQMSATPK